MAKPSVVKVLPEEIVELDSIENQKQAFLVAMKDILNTQCRMMMDKDNYVEHKRIERIVLPKGFKIISS